jgi:hypothetical protein
MYLESRLKSVREDTPVATVIETNQLIALLAARASCHELTIDEKYRNEFVKYSNVVRQWNAVLRMGAQL